MNRLRLWDESLTSKLIRVLWILVALVSALSMWFYVGRIWSVGQPEHFSDLYARWWGAHELLLHHRDPYGVEVSREIQKVIYGAPLSSSGVDDPQALGGGFAYPVYVAFLLWPTLWIPYVVVQRCFDVLLPLCTFLSLLLWLRALNWRPHVSQFVTVSLFVLGSFPSLQGAKLQNLSLLVAFLIAATVAALAADRLVIAGITLAIATIKPQFVFLLALWLCAWALHDWKNRQRFVWSFGLTMVLLVGAGELIAPGWIPRFLHVARAYREYTFGHSVLDLWFTPRIGVFIAAGLTFGVAKLCWDKIAGSAYSSAFVMATIAVLATTVTVIPTLEPHAQLLLMPAFLFLLAHSQRILGLGKKVRLLVAAGWALPAWSWIATTALALAALWSLPATLHRFWLIPLYSSPLIPVAVLLLFLILLAHSDRLLEQRTSTAASFSSLASQ